MEAAKILIVEDEIIIARDIENSLQDMGFNVVSLASSGESAMDEAHNKRPDIVLMDIVLKGKMDGIEAAELIRSQFKIPVIFVTAYTDEDMLDRAKITGPFGYIVKPFDDRELRASIEMALYKSRLEAKLMESEERMRLILEGTDEGLWDWDMLSGEITFDDNWPRILGYETGERQFDYKWWEENLHPDSKPVFEKMLGGYLNGRETFYELEYRMRAKSGEYKWIWARGICVSYNKDGTPRKMIGTHRDITDRKRMEEELQKVRKLESIGVLAGGIAHDFNNILMTLWGNIQLVKMNLDPKSENFEMLAESEQGCIRAKGLTGQLLTFARGGAPVKKLVSIGRLIGQSAKFALHDSNVNCQLSIPDELWMARVDQAQISQVLESIIINADQAMPDGGTIKVSAQNFVPETQGRLQGPLLEDGKYIKITIADQGIGIPEDHLPKVFDAYFTTKQKGSGLGLAISYSIIKNHNGYIAVKSSLSEGSTFDVYIRAAEETVLPGPDQEQKLLAGKERVLIMDDDEQMNKLTGKMLKHLGYEVELVGHGDEAVRAYKSEMESDKPFAAVILDLTVPGAMGGEETIKKLLKIDRRVTAIIASGYGNEMAMADFGKYGFQGVIVKPYKIEELKKVLNDVIGRNKKIIRLVK